MPEHRHLWCINNHKDIPKGVFNISLVMNGSSFCTIKNKNGYGIIQYVRRWQKTYERGSPINVRFERVIKHSKPLKSYER